MGKNPWYFALVQKQKWGKAWRFCSELIILVVLPYYVLNALRGKYEKEEKEEVGSGVADELQEWFSAKQRRLAGLW